MKSIIAAIALTLSTLTCANQEAQFTQTLESQLRFSGYVEIIKITTADDYSIVELYVGSYGEERPTTCVFKYEKLMDCKADWFEL